MVKLAQRYAKATQSSNLKSDDMHFDTDKLAAVALSGDFASLLFRVKYANDATSYVRLAEAWDWDVKKRAALARPPWPPHINDAAVAKASLKYWLNDLCPACCGKGVKKMDFEELLSDDACEVCDGSGKRPLQCEPRIEEYVGAMVLVLESMTITAGHMAMAKLSSAMDLE